jgi:hypothetical protein
VKLPSGKWSSDYGQLIGKIIENEGFFPNERYVKELEAQKQLSFSDETTDLSYGKYALLQFLSQDVLERLRLCFPGERGLQIYCYGLILCANGFVHMDQVGEFYQESFLSLIYRNHSFKMGYDSVRTLLHDLGMKGNPVRMFEQGLIDDSSGNVAIDGHVIRSCSSKNDLADPGYKVRELKSAQINYHPSVYLEPLHSN